MGGLWGKTPAAIPTDQHVVIVGGGYGGTELALGLKAAGAKYTIIDRKDSFQHVVGAVRAITENGLANKIYIPFKDTFGENFVQGTVVGIDPVKKEVWVEGCPAVSYDILVIATGGTSPFPAHGGARNKAEAVEDYGKYLEKVRNSDRVVIVGGGPVGVEMCGEIATDYPEKKVTLVHSRDWLVWEALNQTFQNRVRQILDTLHVKVVCGQKVVNMGSLPEQGPYKLITDKDSNEIEADMVINCTGSMKINSEAYKSGLEASMDEKGQLKVNDYLQVEGQKDIYAVGDCTNLKEAKLAYLAQEHAKVVLENLSLKAQSQPLKKYTLDSKPFVLTLSVGRNNGLGQSKFYGFMLPEFVIKSVKSKDVMVKHYWDRMGQQLPA